MKNHAHTHNSTETHGSLRVVPLFASEREVVAVYARQASELAEMVADAMTHERERHTAAMQSLRVVETALAEQKAQLTVLANRFGWW